MTKWWSNPAVVDKTPIVTTVLLEGANVSQLLRMWSERSALGQSLTGWLSVGFALVLWWNFYRIVTPNANWARWATAFGIGMNALVCLTVVYFRWIV